jgi:ribosome-binding protein aMBF1 (putative translation factor)
MSFQDWNVVIFNKKETKPVVHARAPSDKIAKSTDVEAPTRIDAETRKKIISMRNQKNLTQAQLAQRLNVDKSIIASYESGTAIMNHNSKLFIQKIFKSLM